MEEIVKHINDTNASYRTVGAGDAKNTDLFLDNEHYELFKDSGEQITVRFNKENLTKAILFISSILPRKYDNSAIHREIPFSTEFVYDQLAFLDGFFTVDGVKVNSRTQVWTARKDVMKANGEIDRRFYFNGLLEDVAYTNYKGENSSAKFTIRNYIAGGYSDLHFKKGENGIFDVWVTNALEPYNDGKEKGLEIKNSEEKISLQQIYYGAPGTGKSFEINRLTRNKEVIRTTFHPDSDYSTFVGAYKPTSIEVPVRDVTGKVIVENGKQVTENRIVYEFVEQAFLQAYTKAWKAYAEKGDDEKAKEQYLVIEEINRGNCAQIFGDLFQLLDRNGAGFSDYPISADKDMKKQLAKAFKGLTIADAERINAIYEKDIVAQMLSGDVLLLPDNLYIWATMNTSDQSLFPIDSAFKRRWDWKYIPISEGKTKTGGKIGYKIKIYGKKYDWWQFLQKINDEIGELTKSEDKKLGYFFCKANNGIIDAETFVSKVIFYLWNDVFKDQDLGTIFNDEDEGELTFNKFYKVDDFGKPMVKEDKVEIFLKNLGLEEVEESTEDMQGDDMDSDQPNTTKDANNRLHVTFPDGETIRIQTSKEYIDILEKIGLDKVYEVAKSKNPNILKCAFVTKEKEDAIENSNYLRYETIGEYHVVRGMSGDTMRPFLEKISNQYNLGLKFYRQ